MDQEGEEQQQYSPEGAQMIPGVAHHHEMQDETPGE